MSPVLATSLAIALYVVALLPVMIAAIWHNARAIMAPYATLLIAVAVYHTGIFHTSSLTPTDVIVPIQAPTDDAQCQQILELMREAGVAIDHSDPAAPTITGSGAEQFPAEVRDALIECSAAATASRPGGD